MVKFKVYPGWSVPSGMSLLEKRSMKKGMKGE